MPIPYIPVIYDTRAFYFFLFIDRLFKPGWGDKAI